MARGLAHLNRFNAYSEMGRLEEAVQACAAAHSEMRAADNPATVVDAVYNTVQLLLALGRLHEAATVCREGLDDAQHQGYAKMPAYGRVHFGLSDVLYEWNDWSRRGSTLPWDWN